VPHENFLPQLLRLRQINVELVAQYPLVFVERLYRALLDDIAANNLEDAISRPSA
jgi:hypothetical protein